MEKYHVLVAVSCFMTLGAVSARAQTAGHEPEVIRLDPAMDDVVSPDARLQVVKRGFGFTEGLNWVHQGKTGYLVFSDVPANVIDKLTPDGAVSVLVNESGYSGPWNGYMALRVGHRQSNGTDRKDPLHQFMMLGSDGLTIDPQGRLVICNYGGRSVYRIDWYGKRVVLADRYAGKRLNGPNDVVVKKDGAIYFTDTFNWALGEKDPTTQLHSLGIYVIKDARVTLVVSDIRTPNGLALSPDEKYLYANTSASNTIRRYAVQPDDTLTNSQLFIDLKKEKIAPGERRGITDGMRVDSKGNVYSSGPVGVWVISPQGKHIGTIRIPETFANFTFGDADDKTLYVGGLTTIYRIRLKVAGKHTGHAVGEY